MVPASEAQCMSHHLNCRTKGGKKGSVHEDLGQDTVEKTLLLQIACCRIFVCLIAFRLLKLLKYEDTITALLWIKHTKHR